MSIKLIDLILKVKFNTEKIQVFDKEDNILFSGTKKNLIEELYHIQTFATRKVVAFQVINNYIVIDID